MAMFIYFFCLCPLGLAIKLNFNEHVTLHPPHTLLILTDWSFDITPVPLHGASRRTRSKPAITFKDHCKQNVKFLTKNKFMGWVGEGGGGWVKCCKLCKLQI